MNRVTTVRTTSSGVPRQRAAQSSLLLETALAEERERRRIAQGLHDQVGHALALAKMKASLLRASAPPAGTETALAEICDCLDTAIREIRSLMFDLSSTVLYEVGLDAALQSLCDRLDGRVDMSVRYEPGDIAVDVGQATALVVYRSVEELAINALKHAQARMVRVAARHRDGRLRVTVTDDGVGLPVDRQFGFGLSSVRERIGQLGGRFDIGPAVEGGTRAVLAVPC